jgi:hypothetical protein
MDFKKLETSVSRIDAIDGLRAVAIVAVIVYHLKASLLPGGYTGVDVFFVISGFVVCRWLLKSVDLPFFRYLAHFFARRLLRIYPTPAGDAHHDRGDLQGPHASGRPRLYYHADRVLCALRIEQFLSRQDE